MCEGEEKNPPTSPERILEVLGGLRPGPVRAAIAETFSRMEVAEREIARACKADPEKSVLFQQAFMALVPTAPLRGFGDGLYRAHCQELLTRVSRGGVLSLATRAEVLGLLSTASLTAPPTETASLLSLRLFEALFPDEARRDRLASPVPDSDEVRALEWRLRKKLEVKDRNLSDRASEPRADYGDRAADLEDLTVPDDSRLETTFVREVAIRYRGPARRAQAIRRPDDAVELAKRIVQDDAREHFVALYLDGRHYPIAHSIVSIGTATASLVHPREVFQSAILVGAVAVVVLHNHPSGDVSPSAEDRAITKRLADAGRILGIRVVDSIIFSRGTAFYSLADTESKLFDSESPSF